MKSFELVLRILKEIFITLNIFLLLISLTLISNQYLTFFIILWAIINISVFLVGFYKYQSFSLKIQKLVQRIVEGKIESIDEISFEKSYSLIESSLRKLYWNKLDIINNLKNIEQYRTEFLGNVSHELRTPIFAMQGFLETLLDGALEDNKVNRTFIEKTYKHSQNLNNLLNDLIDISMIESGRMRMSFRYFDIGEFLKAVMQENLHFAKRKNLDLKLNLFTEKVLVFGDQNRLRQVMNNLIQNAVKYTENGFVEISGKDLNNKIEISVSDSGIGIPEEDIHRIFERFYRVDKNRSKEEGGTGLGLAIVKHILDAHGGNIRVESKIGKGSKFSFYLRK